MNDDLRDPRWKEMHAARLREAVAFFTPEALWSQLTVSEALSLVRAMPKMASKWDDRPRDSYRYSAKGSLVAHIWADGNSWYGWSESGCSSDKVVELVVVKGIVDEALREDGWLLEMP